MDILVDSNVLVYAINTSSPKHAAAQNFLNKNNKSLVIAHQNILESLRVLTHPKFSSPMSATDALAAITAIGDSCRIITPDLSASYLAIELIKQQQITGNQIFDAYLAATALAAGLRAIATDNARDFQKFAGVQIINPFL